MRKLGLWVGLFSIGCAAQKEPPKVAPLAPDASVWDASASTEVATPRASMTETSEAPKEAPTTEHAVPVTALFGDPTCDERSICQGESCCTKLTVPAGSFQDRIAGPVTVASFQLDKYELTVGRVQKWLAAGRPVPKDGARIGRDSTGREILWHANFKVQSEEKLKGWERYDTWGRGQGDLPKNFIDWYTSAAVCHFAGGRLPSDAEWRYAAVGGDENRKYPWGNEAQTPEHAVYNCMGDGDKSCSLGDILPVGSRPKGQGRFGQMDLAGSMFEWTLDAAGAKEVVSRGGGFCYIGGQDRRAHHQGSTSNVRHEVPGNSSHMVGARCAFDTVGEPELAAR